MLPPDPAALVEAYDQLVTATRARVVAYVAASWSALAHYNRSDVDRFVAGVVPVVTGGQKRIASLTDAYLAQMETSVLGRQVRPLGVVAPTVQAIRGVTAEEVYGRAGIEVWSAMKNRVSFRDAVARGLDRATSSAATDLQLARTHTALQVMEQRPNIVGYRRVLHGPESCPLCVTASTQRYQRSTLMPIHSHCDCGIAPIFGDSDPGQVINHDLLKSLKGGPTTVHHHGELGPVLTVPGQRFTLAP